MKMPARHISCLLGFVLLSTAVHFGPLAAAAEQPALQGKVYLVGMGPVRRG